MKIEKLILELSRNVEPVRPLHHPVRRYIYWICFSLPFAAIVTFWIGARPDLATVMFNRQFIFQMVTLLFLFSAVSVSAFFLGVPDTRNRRFVVFSGVMLVCGLLIFIRSLMLQAFIYPASGWNCIRNILFICTPPAMLSYHLLSRAYPLKKSVAGLFAFLGASTLACLTTRFICANDDFIHFFVWHCVPSLLIGALGFLAGHFFLRKWVK